eukprot:2610912-Amphidinium_carterae.3
MIHNAHIEDSMRSTWKSLDDQLTIDIKKIPNDYTADDVARLQQRFRNVPTEDDELEEYNDMTLTIRRKRMRSQASHRH